MPAGGQVVWTGERTALREWLTRNAKSLAELYEGAVVILYEHDPLLPGWSRLVAHAVREVRNRLPDAVAGKKVGERLDYPSRLDEIAGMWSDAGLATAATPAAPSVLDVAPAANPGVLVPRGVYDRVSDLIREHEEARERPVDSAFRLFEAISPGNKGQRAALEPTVNQWLRVTRWFQGKAHDGGVADGGFSIDEYRRQFETFEAMLIAVIRDFFKTTDELDKILEDTNT